jgi:hypothetical protein
MDFRFIFGLESEDLILRDFVILRDCAKFVLGLLYLPVQLLLSI